MTDPVFFPVRTTITVGEAAEIAGARLVDSRHAGRVIDGIASVSEGGEGKLVFITSAKARDKAEGLRAAALFCPEDLASAVPDDVACLVVRNPALAFATVGARLVPDAVMPGSMTAEDGISSSAHIHPTAKIEAGAIIEAGAVIGPRAAIGSGAVIGPNAVIGADCQVGRGSVVGAHVSVRAALIGNRVILHPGVRIGQDGFGFVPGPTGLVKQPHIGRVVVQDDVEIGANTTIDRGSLGDTVIGEGTKIDNLVQIAHNVKIGRMCVIAGHVGISGSVTVGDGVMLGGRVGIADHLTIGDGAQLAASSGVMHDVPAGARWAGAPARPIKEFFREVAAIRSLTEKPKNKKEQGDG